MDDVMEEYQDAINKVLEITKGKPMIFCARLATILLAGCYNAACQFDPLEASNRLDILPDEIREWAKHMKTEIGDISHAE